MYISLYRKFRPDTFSKMVRQEHVVTVLKNQIASGAVGHAYLFCGPRGTGKTSVARIFARAVNCINPQDGSPCGACETCRTLSEGNLDIVEIDAASNNGVNEMRDLREKVQYPPVAGKFKVYIIDEVHMLTDSAFNALLKTLEEPPVHAVFILATTEPHKIPATILSRCMRLDFKLIPEEDLEAHLTRILDEIGKPYEKEAVAAIARAGAGSDRDMLSIAEMCISYEDKLTYEGVTAALGAADFHETCKLCAALVGSDMPTALADTEKILAEGKSVGVLLRDVLQTLNQIAVAKTCRNAEKLLSLPKTHFERIAKIAEQADVRAILRASEILAKTENELRFVSSPRIALETAIMKTSLPAADDSTDALLVRIGKLENALASMPVPLAKETAQAAVPEIQETADYLPPEEEPVFCEAYFSDEPLGDAPVGEPPVPQHGKNAKKTVQAQPDKVETREAAPSVPPQIPSVQKDSAAVKLPAELTFGKFMRILRKTSKNGVLFTMCTDLEAEYEGDRLILYTGSPTVCRSLSRPEHREIMQTAFQQLGVSDFEVRLRGEKPTGRDAVQQLKQDFHDYPIEIK